MPFLRQLRGSAALYVTPVCVLLAVLMIRSPLAEGPDYWLAVSAEAAAPWQHGHAGPDRDQPERR